MDTTYTELRRPRTSLRSLHQHVRKNLGQQIDWLRIYIVNEEEILLAGTCASPATRRRVADIVQAAAPRVRLRNAIVLGELPPGLRLGALPVRDSEVDRHKQ